MWKDVLLRSALAALVLAVTALWYGRRSLLRHVPRKRKDELAPDETLDALQGLGVDVDAVKAEVPLQCAVAPVDGNTCPATFILRDGCCRVPPDEDENVLLGLAKDAALETAIGASIDFLGKRIKNAAKAGKGAAKVADDAAKTVVKAADDAAKTAAKAADDAAKVADDAAKAAAGGRRRRQGGRHGRRRRRQNRRQERRQAPRTPPRPPPKWPTTPLRPP